VWQQERRYIKDPTAEAVLYQGRAVFAIALIVIVFLVIFSRYVYLQIFQYQRFKTESDNNRVHVQSLAPKRGLIYDRKGRLLAENISSQSLVLVRERVPDLDETLSRLQLLLAIDDDDIEDFRRRLKRQRPFEEVPLLFDLSEHQIAKVAVNIHTLPGVELQAQLVRYYPYGELFGHVIGYVGRINEREQKTLDVDNYAATYSIGKLGVEKYYESQLHGTVGYQNVETDVRGRILRVLDQTDPTPGKDLYLHLDVDMQRAGYEALAGRRGSVVAMNVKNGGLHAVVSSPSYDGNLFVNGISSKDYAALRDSRDLPLFNRSIQGQYPPASTVKPLIGMAGLHYGTVTPSTTVPDPGWYQLPNDTRFYRDWKRQGHAARINLADAVIESCDVYFYDLAYKLGIDKIHSFMDSFGFGRPTGVDLTSERGGLMPSREWKKRTQNLPWFPGETLNIGIGQGYLLATPMQLAAATVALANKGQWIQPRALNKLGDRELLPIRRDTYDVAPAHWDLIHSAMLDVTQGARGTARAAARGLSYDMSGKTGTAQVVGIAQGEEYDSESLALRKRDHALFVGYAPSQNPQIAVAVVIENAEHSSEAVKVARAVMDAFFLDENGEFQGVSQ